MCLSMHLRVMVFWGLFFFHDVKTQVVTFGGRCLYLQSIQLATRVFWDRVFHRTWSFPFQLAKFKQPPVPASPLVSYRRLLRSLTFTLVLEFRTQVLMQALTTESHLPPPGVLYKKVFITVYKCKWDYITVSTSILNRIEFFSSDDWAGCSSWTSRLKVYPRLSLMFIKTTQNDFHIHHFY